MTKPTHSAEPSSNEQDKQSGDAEGHYEIGFGKAPKHTRFQSGMSGNPKGRPKGVRNFKTDVKETLDTRVKIKGENTRTLSTQKAMLLRLREKALHGDGRALDQLIKLAQTYNDDEITAGEQMPTDDVHLLQLYQRRLMTGAIERLSDTDKDSNAQLNDEIIGDDK